jgi:hypothetical protein
MDAEAAYQEIVERGGRVSSAMRAFRTFLGHRDMMAYLGLRFGKGTDSIVPSGETMTGFNL